MDTIKECRCDIVEWKGADLLQCMTCQKTYTLREYKDKLEEVKTQKVGINIESGGDNHV